MIDFLDMTSVQAVVAEVLPVVGVCIREVAANDGKHGGPWRAAPGRKAGRYVARTHAGVGQPDEFDGEAGR